MKKPFKSINLNKEIEIYIKTWFMDNVIDDIYFSIGSSIPFFFFNFNKFLQ